MEHVEVNGLRIAFRRTGRPAADHRKVLPDIRVPTLLLHGDDDERATRPVAEALHAAIPDAALVTVPGFGHDWYIEPPETFNAEVHRFLNSPES